MIGILVCYNEDKNGPFDEAIRLSNESYVIWKNPTSMIKDLKYPTKIIIKISGMEEYYLGNLLMARPFKDFNPRIFVEDKKHRPSNWTSGEEESEYVFFISDLKNVQKPKEINDVQPQPGVVYVDFKD